MKIWRANLVSSEKTIGNDFSNKINSSKKKTAENQLVYRKQRDFAEGFINEKRRNTTTS